MRRDTAHRQKGHVKMKAQTGVIYLQGKDHQGLTSTTRKRQGRISRGGQTFWHLDFGLPTSITVRQHIFVVLSHPVYGALLQQSSETIQP